MNRDVVIARSPDVWRPWRSQTFPRRLRLPRRLIVMWLWLLAMTCAAADPLPDRTLALEESVRLALNNSPALLSSREDVNIAMQRVREAESLFFPRLDLNASWSKFRVDGDTPLELQPALGPTLITSSPRQNFYSARANIYQTVYEGGRSRNLWRQARISYERARSANESLQTQVMASAKQAFYDLLFAREKRSLLGALVKESQAQAVHGMGSLTDQIRLENELALLRTRTSEAEQAEQEARRTYLQRLNLELNTSVALNGSLETHPVHLDLAKLLAWSTQFRSELQQTEYQQELDALGISLSLAERQPTIGFGATYERTGHDTDFPAFNWAGTLNVNLPVSISDLVFGWAKVRERRAQYRQATLKHAEVADQIQLQVRQAYDRYQFWQEELTPRQQSLERLQSLASALRKESSRTSERLEAQRIVTEARLRYLEAVHGHLTALASLERAVGKPLNEER
jgi:outer membrane protein TolC